MKTATGILKSWATIGKQSHLLQRILSNKQIVHFKRLVACNGRKFIQKLIDTDANTHEV